MRALLPFIVATLILPASSHLRAAENVAVPAFKSVELRGGGNVVVVPGQTQRVTIVEGSSQVTRFRMKEGGRLQIDICDRQCPRNYSLQVRIESPRVPDLAISGGGGINVSGGFSPQSHIAVAIDGGGKIDARAVEVRDVTAAVDGGGRINVRAGSILTAAVDGGGAIRYSGNPRVTSAIDGGGSVTREN